MNVPEILYYVPESVEDARRVQRQLATRVKLLPLSTKPRIAAALDVAYSENLAACACVLWDIEQNRQIDAFVVQATVKFPYIPTLLSFREAPAIAEALKQLTQTPDLLLIDGQGIAHPLGVGIASHIGAALDLPAVGVAKSILYGKLEGPLGPERGSTARLLNPRTKQPIGAAVRTRTNVKPVFVSPGHRIDLDSAITLVLSVGAGYRLPEPLRIADKLSKRAAHGLPLMF